MTSPHFQKLSKNLLGLRDEGFLLDAEITTQTTPVRLHKLILALFSNQDKVKTTTKDGILKLNASGYKAEDVENLVRLLYDGETKPGDSCADITKCLNLNLYVEQKSKKTTSQCKQKSVQKRALELIYLRNLTFQMGVSKLLSPPRSLADVKLRTGNIVHRGHKLILSAMSEYFTAMFISGMRESTEDIIDLQGIEAEMFKTVLNYIYSGKCSLTVENVQSILSTAVYFQLDRLQLMCERYLLENIDVENCSEIWKLAEVYSCKHLLLGAIKFIVNHFSSLNKVQLIQKLTREDMIALVRDNNLNSSSEEEVLQFVLNWISKNPSDQQADTLLQHVRLELVDERYLQEVLESNNFMKTQPKCVHLMKEALQAIRSGNITTKPRTEEALVVIKRSSYQTGIEVACYSFTRQAWFKLQDFPLSPGGSGYAAATDINNIYVSGGSATPRMVYKFSIEDNTWTQLADLIEARSSHAMGCVEGKLYVLGGSSLSSGAFDTVSSIEKLDLATNSWTKIANMSTPTFDSAYATVKKQILIFGGAIAARSGVYVMTIQCFDTQTETCSILYHNLPYPLALAVACVHNNDVYVMCTDRKIIHYNEDTPPYVINPESKGSQLMEYATVFHNNAIYTLGGYAIVDECVTINRFDLKTKRQCRWPETELPFARETNKLFAAVMFVSRKYLKSETQYKSSVRQTKKP